MEFDAQLRPVSQTFRGTDTYGTGVMCCPVCGDEHVHPHATRVAAETRRVLVNAGGTMHSGLLGPDPEKDGTFEVQLRAACNNQHQFDLVLHYANGQMSVQFIALEIEVEYLYPELYEGAGDDGQDVTVYGDAIPHYRDLALDHPILLPPGA